MRCFECNVLRHNVATTTKNIKNHLVGRVDTKLIKSSKKKFTLRIEINERWKAQKLAATAITTETPSCRWKFASCKLQVAHCNCQFPKTNWFIYRTIMVRREERGAQIASRKCSKFIAVELTADWSGWRKAKKKKKSKKKQTKSRRKTWNRY